MSKLIISFLLLPISLSLYSQNQQQSFSDNLTYPVFEATEKYSRFNSEILQSEVILTKALGDLNADGIKDFAIFNFNKFSIHLSNDVANPEFIYTPQPGPTWLNIDAGDFNGDGYSDIIVLNGYDFESPETKIEFYFGSSEFDLVVDKVIEVSSDLSSYINYNVSGVRNAGDINGDQKNDFIVYTNNDIFLFYGADEINSIPDLSIRHETLPINDPRILSGADLNGDGFDELIFGFWNNSDVLIYFGASTMLTDNTPDMVLNSSYPMYETIHEHFTWSIESGDFNSDSYDDLIIIPLSMRTENLAQEGIRAMHLFYGGENFDTQVDKLLKIPSACFDINITQFVNQFYGELTAIPDLNNDGSNELLIGGGTVVNNNGGEDQAMRNGIVFDVNASDSILIPMLELHSGQQYFGSSNKYFSFNCHSAIDDFNNDGIYELLTPVSISSEFGSEVNRYDLNSEKYLYLKDSLDHVGIKDKLVSSWELYPNPVKDILNLRDFVPQGTVTECIIYDINGRAVLRKEFLDEPISINMQDLSPSVYLVRIVSGDEKFTMRVIKE